ncbi:hypothetical protein OSB04_006912 [Centaurea solstitialis]|uniref:Reverse transcriptase Ty1/copia-type domain-containing protein n=1 Tax=Centaurea solstitialis TaxID=347529 RepID=A0AA38WI41_9ASTR|nr:hypothetical protein OSB04_006912 [Centaurea solstitialis]
MNQLPTRKLLRVHIGRQLCNKNFRLLIRHKLGILFHFHPARDPLALNRSSKSKQSPMVALIGTKPVLWQKGFNLDYDINYEKTFALVSRMDVKNAFLNGDLSEEVYMTHSPGVSLPTGHVCHLRKALYGLKQAPRAWFEKFSNTVLFLGFSTNTEGTYLCQAKYISDLLFKAGITNNKVASTPLEHNLHLAPNAGPPLRYPTLYRQLVGSLVYLTVTLPDIAGAEEACIYNTRNDPLAFAKRHLRGMKYLRNPLFPFLLILESSIESKHYLCGAKLLNSNAKRVQSKNLLEFSHFAARNKSFAIAKGIMFHGMYFSCMSSLILHEFSDANWDTDVTDRCSTTSIAFSLVILSFFGVARSTPSQFDLVRKLSTEP